MKGSLAFEFHLETACLIAKILKGQSYSQDEG